MREASGTDQTKAGKAALDAAQHAETLLKNGWDYGVDNGDIVLRPAGAEVNVKSVQNWAEGFPVPAKITVHRAHRDAPAALREAMGFGRDGNATRGLPVEAAYDVVTGEVHVFANMIKDEDHLHRVLTEEIVGHGGLRALLGDRLDDFLRTANIPRAKLLPIARRYRLNLNDENDLLTATEEYIAKLTPAEGSTWNKFVDWLRQVLRDLGIKIELTDEEASRLLWRAREAVLRGTAPPASFSAEVSRQEGGSEPLRSGTRFSVAWTQAKSTPIQSKNDEVEKILDRVIAKSEVYMSPAEKLHALKNQAASLFENWQLKAKQGLLDSGASIEAIERSLNNGQLFDASLSAWKAYTLTKNLPGVMSAVIKFGVPILETGWFTIDPKGKGLAEIFAPLVTRNGNLLRLWEGYAAARRAKQLSEQTNPDGSPREKLLSEKDINALLDLENEYPILKQVFDEYQEFNGKLLDLAVETGLLSKETRDLWADFDYVPFYRVFEEAEGPSGPSTGGSAEVRSTGIKRLRGSDKQLQPILENITLNTANLIDKIFKHEAMKRIRDMALQVNAMEELPQSWKPVRLTNRQIASALKKSGLLIGRALSEAPGQSDADLEQGYLAVVEKMHPQELEQFQTLFQMATPPGKDVVGVIENGRTKYYRVTDPLLLRTIKGMGPENFGHVMALMRGFKKTLTTWVTTDPGFMLANWMRDTLSSFVTSSDVNFTPVLDSVKAFADIWGEDRNSVYSKVVMAGGAGGGFYDVHPGDLTRTMAEKTGATVLNTPLKIWAAWRRIGNLTEQSNRIAIAAAVLKKGGTIAEAAFQAQDVTNFTMHGDWKALQVLTQAVPFLNARLQGLYKLYRGGRDNPVQFFLRGAGVVAATMLLLARNWDDERYEELPDWQKDIYWHLFIGDEHFAIPKPFEAGVIFGSLPERIIRLTFGRDDLERTGRYLATTVGETFALNPIPQIAKPLIEQWANKSFFSGRDIVPFFQTSLDPEAQYRPWTSSTARLIADLMPDWAPDMFRSPLRIEHLVRGYLGTVGMYVLTAADSVTNSLAGYPPKPQTGLLDFPAVRRFIRGSGPQPTRYEQEMWDALKRVDATFSTLNAFTRQGRTDAANELREKRGEDLAIRESLRQVANAIRELNDVERQIMFSLMPPEEKRARLDQIQEQKNQILRRTIPRLLQ